MNEDLVRLSLNYTPYLLIPFNKPYLLWMIEKEIHAAKNDTTIL